MENSVSSPGLNDQFSFVVKREASVKIENVHVFITDEDLHTYAHVLPTRKTDGAYSFDFNPPLTAKYRFEVVFRTDRGWVNLRKNLKLKKGEGAEPDTKPGDDDYAIKIKPFPGKIYAEHVGTFLYEIHYKGAPVGDLERLDGFDMQVAAWDEDLKEFIYMTPAFGEALMGTGAPADWVVSEEDAAAVVAQEQQMMAMQNAAGMVNAGATVAQNVGKAGQELQIAGMV